MIDLFDNADTTVKEWYCIEVLEISPNGDRVATFADIAMFPFIGEVIGDYTHYATEIATTKGDD